MKEFRVRRSAAADPKTRRDEYTRTYAHDMTWQAAVKVAAAGKARNDGRTYWVEREVAR